MNVDSLIETLNVDFFTGVPDSQLKPLCDFLYDQFGVDGKHHIICANEGNCTGVAAGYYLATGKIPAIYMQNSGEGNAINPIASLLNKQVYAIPAIFIIGWRGEPNVHDEPQHIFQGSITLKLLNILKIKYFVISKETTIEDFKSFMLSSSKSLAQGNQIALVVKKGALSFSKKTIYSNNFSMTREEIIKHITNVSAEDPIISTTGKASRELFEIRERNNQNHGLDFLTVGSMGHSSSIGLGIALQKPNKKIWIIDGDGSALMHLGSMAVIGSYKPNGIVHIVINNGSHETVGGQPTVMKNVDLQLIAQGCGYPIVRCVDNVLDLDKILVEAKNTNELFFIEVKSSIGSRADLGRPTTSPIENKNSFMSHI